VAGELSEAAQGYRTGMLAMIVLALAGAALTFAAIKGWANPALALPAILIVGGGSLGAAWMGLKGHTQVRQDRERASGQFMIISIAAQLGKQDDATLQKIAGKGGPAGEAAGREQRARASSASPKIQS
jgi:hypothetical protein